MHVLCKALEESDRSGERSGDRSGDRPRYCPSGRFGCLSNGRLKKRTPCGSLVLFKANEWPLLA